MSNGTGPSYVLSEEIKRHFITAPEYWSFKTVANFLEYFLAAFDDRFRELNVVFNVFDIQETEIPSPEVGHLNVLVCEENCLIHNYPHRTRFGDFGDPNVQIYIYSHIDEPVITSRYIAIPGIWMRIAHFQRFKERDSPPMVLDNARRQFALRTTPNWRNAEVKQSIFEALSQHGAVDTLTKYKSQIHFESMRSNPRFLGLLHNYKFIIACENSTAPGYITEKIFNAFLSKSIPIYWGSEPEKYFNEEAFLDIKKLGPDGVARAVQQLQNDPQAYEWMVNMPKIKADVDPVALIVAFIRAFEY